MDKNCGKNYFFMLLLTSALLFFCNISTAQAVYSSNISIPLFGDGFTIKNGQLKLEFTNVGSMGTLTYIASGSNLPFHTFFPDVKYLGIDIIRDEKVIFTMSVNGDTKQEVLTKAMSNLKVKDTDILHFYLAEPKKEEINNFEKETSLPSAQYREYFQKDMYYMMTYGGFIPVNNGISHYMYDQYKSNTSANQLSSLFSKNILNFGYSGFTDSKYKFFGTVEPDTQFHSYFPGESYYSISYYKITDNHQLSSPIYTASALGDTTYSNMGNQLYKIPVMNGTIYKLNSKEPSKIRLWNNGISRQLKMKNQKETYVELTKSQGLVELDFNRVVSKAVTVELGSPPEKINVADFTDVSDYPNLSSSFKTDVKTEKLGTYDQEILIKQNLITASNYLLSTVNSEVTVVDTTSPTAKGKANVEIPIYGLLPINPADLLEDLKDNSGTDNLKIEYLDENGDTTVPGIKKVKIRIMDASKNFTDVTVSLTVVPSTLTIKNVPTLNFGKIKIGDSTKSINRNDESTVAISIDDLRGTKAGWTLQASVSNFTTQDGKKLNAQISLMNGTILNIDNKIEGMNVFDISLTNNLQTVIQAKEGSGMKNSTITFKNEDIELINISPDARVGSYEATVNWVLLDTP